MIILCLLLVWAMVTAIWVAATLVVALFLSLLVSLAKWIHEVAGTLAGRHTVSSDRRAHGRAQEGR